MPKYTEKVQRGIYKRIVGALSGLAEIDVEIHPQESPHYDTVTKTVVMPTSISYADNENEDFELGRGIVLHEGSHVLFLPKYIKIVERIDREEGKEAAMDWQEWFNVFVDINNEWKLSKVFPHLKPHLIRKTERLFEKHKDRLKSDNPFMQVLIRGDALANLKPEFPDDYPDQLKKFVLDTVKELKELKLHSVKGGEVLKFTSKVHGKWKKIKRGSTTAPPVMGDLYKQLGDAIGRGDERAEDQINKAIDDLSSPRWYKQGIDRELLRPANGEGVFSEEDIQEIISKIKESDQKIKSHGKLGAPPKDDTIERINPELFTDGEEFPIDKKEAYDEGKQINRALRQKVKLQEDYERRHRNGMVDIEEIRKQIAAVGRIYKPTIFKRRNIYSRGGSWAISILVDCSSSMSEIMSQAKQALATLAYALDGLPNVKYELIGFSCMKHVIEIPIKEYRELRFKMPKLMKLEPIGGTPTSNVMNSSIRRIMQFKGMKRIMVVITDGMPADKQATFQASKRAEDLGIKVIGIGIDVASKTMKEIFPTTYIFNRHKDLDKDITNLILSALHTHQKVRLVKRAWE